MKTRAVLTAVLATALVATPASAAPAPPRPAPPTPVDCPESLAGTARCYTGRDAAGAYWTVAVPRRWNGALVVHAHGGPDRSVEPGSTMADLAEWAVMVEQGHAWAASSYRRGGYGVRTAAADTENVRRLFVQTFGRPKRTYLHGQSYGGNVAAKAAELYGRSYDGVLLTNGLLAGGSRGYDHRVDLRVVYQYYCRNLPRPSEPQYPLWQGLPADSTLTPDDVHERLQECTGIDSEPAARTAEQRRNLDDVLAVTRIPGSHDDAALNAGVARFAADPTARRDLSYDSDLTGRVSVPVLTLHAIGDPSVFVEHESAYRATLRAAGNGHRLVQTFTTETEHGGLAEAEYAASINALDAWARTGRKPTPHTIARACGGGCFYAPDYVPPAYSTRVRPRPGGTTWPAMTAAQERARSRIEGVGIAP